GRRLLACDIAELAPMFSLPGMPSTQYAAGPAAIPQTSLTPTGSSLTAPYSSAIEPAAQQSQMFIPSYVSVPGRYGSQPKSRTAAGLLGIFLGMFGAHRFYLGHNVTGTIMLLLTLLTCG